MALPNLPARTAQEELSDQTKELNKQLDLARKAMEGMSAADLPAILEQLQKVAKTADAAGPSLASLFKLDPSGARGLRSQFQSIIDKAAEMAGAAKEKAKETSDALAAAQDKERRDGLRTTARTIRNLPGGGLSGAVGLAASALGPEGEVAAAAFEAVTSAVQQAVSAVSDFVAESVKAADPGVWQRYERASQDFTAVFGNALSPIIELATHLTDQLNGMFSEVAPDVADLVSTLTSDFEPVIEAVMEAVQAWVDVFHELWAENGPQIKSFIQNLAEGMLIVVKTVELLVMAISKLAAQFKQGIGLDASKAVKDAAKDMADLDKKAKDAANAKTFAARPAQFAGIEDVGKAAQAAAASQGDGAAKDTSDAKQMATIADALAKFLVDSLTKLDIIAAGVQALTNPGKTIHDTASAGIATAEGLGKGLAKKGLGPLAPLFGL